MWYILWEDNFNLAAEKIQLRVVKLRIIIIKPDLLQCLRLNKGTTMIGLKSSYFRVKSFAELEKFTS